MVTRLVIIPTYNEIENIEKIIENVFSQQRAYDILVVDDNSPDGTYEAVIQLQNKYIDKLFILSRSTKNGLGRAYIDGFKWALRKHYEYIFQMDADFSHSPNDLIRLYNYSKKKNADLVIGSRYKTGVNVVNWPMSRVLLSYMASQYVRFITGMNIQDTTAGFVCYRRRVLESIDLDSIKFVGYAFQIEMKFKTYLKGYRIKELSVIFVNRTRGESKMNSTIISEALFGVILMKFKSMISGKINYKSSQIALICKRK